MAGIYEINTRVWLREQDKVGKIRDVDATFWDFLKSSGIEMVWLMGVWHTSPASIAKYCFHPDLQKEYDHCNPNWQSMDVQGSPYAIDRYIPSPLIGSTDDLKQLKEILNAKGLSLILDFVPNHFNAESELRKEHPELFFFQSKTEDPNFFSTELGAFAHGRDPYFPPWTDTIQLNYFHPSTHAFMTEELQSIAELCDGVRCDMAMLILPDVFKQTWGYLQYDHPAPANFWQHVIPLVRDRHPNFKFIAETYWDREWDLQQLGFDFTYDKRLLDRLKEGNISAIRDHLKASLAYQNRMVRFLENHDEQRSLQSLGGPKSRAASVIAYTTPGLNFFYHGQWKGHRLRQPVQLTLPADEHLCPCSIDTCQANSADIICRCQASHYESLLKIDLVRQKKGTWQLLEIENDQILTWIWSDEDVHLIAINYSENWQQAVIELDQTMREGDCLITDLISQSYRQDHYRWVSSQTLQIDLPAYKFVILRFTGIGQS